MNLMNSLQTVTALDIAEGLPKKALAPLLLIQEDVTMDKALSAPILQEVVKKMGRATLLKLVCATLKLFCESINISQSMNAVQVYETGSLWLERYPTETLKDLILCLKRAKQGDYGKIYNRFDGEVFNDFWSKYLIQKAEYRENRHLDQKAREASDERGLLKSIAQHIPGAAQSISQSLLNRSTNVVVLPTNHERYVRELAQRLPFASQDEMNALRLQALVAKLSDVVSLIDAELKSRAIEFSDLPNESTETRP